MVYASEIRRMTDGEIDQAIMNAKEELFNLRIQWNIGQLQDYTRIRQLKKDIARYLTVKRERELAAQVVQQEESDAQ